MNYSIYDNLYVVQESVKEIEHGFDTGIKIKGTSIKVLVYKNTPTKEDIENNLNIIKVKAKIVDSNWKEILNKAAEYHKKYIDNKNDKNNSLEMAKRSLKCTLIILRFNKNLEKKSIFQIVFSSSIMNKDGHEMTVNVGVVDNEFVVDEVSIDG